MDSAGQKTSTSKGVEKLNQLIGLTTVKQQLGEIINSIRANKRRAEITSVGGNDFLTFVFRGNPTTGKTTVARMMGEILCEYGILKSPEVVECSRFEIVGPYIGQTAPRVRELFERAKGKTLFIDEIHSLATSEHDDFGKEAINEIVALMTSPEFQGQMAFVITGYPDETNNFLAQNPGIKRRFNYYIDFEDYTNEELWEIFLSVAKSAGFTVEDNCRETAIKCFKSIPRGKNFGNAGCAHELFQITKLNLDNRIAATFDLDNVDASVLNTITLQDFSVK
jgi:AAA+ superfamily predicted ATPase